MRPTTVEGTAPSTSFLVRDAMHVGFVDCPPQTPMREAGRLMAEHGVHCVVVDGLARAPRHGEQLVWGVVSDLDLVNAVAAGRVDDQAGEFAATALATIKPDEDLQRAAQLMAEHDCSHLIVTDESSGRPVGVISSLDIAGGLVRASTAPAPASHRITPALRGGRK